LPDKHYILGLSTNEQPCPVCDVKPQMFKATGTENVVECGRCGLPSGIDLETSPGDRIPRPAANPVWIGIFREYWQDTRQKFTAPDLVGDDVELAGRMLGLNAWLERHQDLVAQATAAMVAPYTSVTAVCVEVEDAGGKAVGRAWSLVLPNETSGIVLALPFPADSFMPGTIITIQTPIPLPGEPPPRESST